MPNRPLLSLWIISAYSMRTRKDQSVARRRQSIRLYWLSSRLLLPLEHCFWLPNGILLPSKVNSSNSLSYWKLQPYSKSRWYWRLLALFARFFVHCWRCGRYQWLFMSSWPLLSSERSWCNSLSPVYFFRHLRRCFGCKLRSMSWWILLWRRNIHTPDVPERRRMPSWFKRGLPLPPWTILSPCDHDRNHMSSSLLLSRRNWLLYQMC